MTVKRWISSLDGWPEKKVSQVEVVRASDYDLLAQALREIAAGRMPEDCAAGSDHIDTLTCARLCGIARAAISASEPHGK